MGQMKQEWKIWEEQDGKHTLWSNGINIPLQGNGLLNAVEELLIQEAGSKENAAGFLESMKISIQGGSSDGS